MVYVAFNGSVIMNKVYLKLSSVRFSKQARVDFISASQISRKCLMEANIVLNLFLKVNGIRLCSAGYYQVVYANMFR